MNRDDLLRLLDLKGKQADPPLTDPTLTSPPRQQPETASPTALDLDGWAIRQGEVLLTESERLQALGLDHLAVADFHGAAFLPEPDLLPACADPLRHRFLGELLRTPQYRALHASTRLREPASSIAAVAFAEAFARLRDEQSHERGSAKGPSDLGDEMAALKAAGKAVLEATREVEDLDDATEALGLGPGSPGSNDPGAIAALFRRVRSSPTLRRICELAGRFRRVARSRQRQKTTHGVDDVVGVCLDGDPARLLTTELARLTDPDLELEVLRRIVERQALCREYHATEPAGKGPICIVVDESGSMAGPKVETAKALALALAWVARQQRRWCALVAYSGSSGERLLALPPGRWDETALLGWLEDFIGRGSDLDLPLRELPDYFWRLRCPEGVTDVVAVTDALLVIPGDLRDQFNAWKRQARVRMISLVVRNQAGDLASVSDEVHCVTTIDPAGDAVGRVLSL